MTDNLKPMRTITRLSDLAAQEVNVRIERDDEVLVIPCRELTRRQHLDIERSVPEVIGDISAAHEIGREGAYINKNHPAYIEARNRAQQKRLMWKIVQFVQLEFAAKDIDGKIEEIETTLPADVITALIIAMSRLSKESQVSVANRAESFHNGGSGDPADTRPEGLDIRPVA